MAIQAYHEDLGAQELLLIYLRVSCCYEGDYMTSALSPNASKQVRN